MAINTGAAAVGFGLVILFASNGQAPFRPSLLPGPYVKITFTIVLLAMAFVVYYGTQISVREVHRVLPPLNQRMLITMLLIGLIGGATAALVGSGTDVFLYLALVVFFTIDPKVGVPTSVVCMALISILGSEEERFPKLMAVVRECLAPDPQSRPNSATEVADRIEVALAAECEVEVVA